jgi:hypothetical protein
MKWLPTILLILASIGFFGAAVGGNAGVFIPVGVVFLVVSGIAARRAGTKQ